MQRYEAKRLGVHKLIDRRIPLRTIAIHLYIVVKKQQYIIVRVKYRSRSRTFRRANKAQRTLKDVFSSAEIYLTLHRLAPSLSAL